MNCGSETSSSEQLSTIDKGIQLRFSMSGLWKLKYPRVYSTLTCLDNGLEAPMEALTLNDKVVQNTTSVTTSVQAKMSDDEGD